MNRTFGMLAASLCVVSASPAFAQDIEPMKDTTVTTMGRDGFYGRVGVGAGYMSAGLSSDESDNEATVSGMGTALGLAAGYAVMPNLVLFGEFNYEMALGPGMTMNGEDVADEFTEDLSMNFLSVGPGAAYFLSNDIFLQGSLLFGSASIKVDENDESDAATGFGLRVGAGKDFQISESFNLGAGANLFYGMLSLTEDVAGTEVTTDVNALSAGITLSGSFN